MKLTTKNGYEFEIDDEDFTKIKDHHWYGYTKRRILLSGNTKNTHSYIISNMKREGKKTLLYLHRFLLDADEIDHRDGNGLNNKKSNLRSCSHSQNLANSKLYSNSKSGYKGVSWKKRQRKWQAHIQVNGKRKFIGYFKTPKEAALAYNVETQKLYGEFSRINEL